MKKWIFLFILFFGLIFILLYSYGTYNIFTIKQETIDSISLRFDNNSLTKEDKKTLRNIYTNIIIFGGFIYPEASKILKHYIFGNGNDLEIISKYFFESEIIKNSIKNNREKELIGPITLKIKNPRRRAAGYLPQVNKIFIHFDFEKAFISVILPRGDG